MGVRLKWSPRVTTGDSQKVYRATAAFDKNSLPAALATISAAASEYEDSGAAASTEYFYAVSVVDGARERISEVVRVTTLTAPTGKILLSGDAQSGTDKILLSGDAQSGTDTLLVN